MKIAIVCNGGYEGEISGGDLHVSNLSKILAKKNDVFFILPAQAKELITEIGTKDRIKLIKIKENKKIRKKEDLILAYLYRAKKTYEFLKENKFDLIITANPFFCDILPLLGLHDTRIMSYIFHVLPERKAENFRGRIFNFLTKIQEKICFEIIKRRAGIILTCNELEGEKIKKIMKTIPVEVMGNSFDTKTIDRVKSQRKKNTALFSGRFVKQKGIYDLVKIMEKIVEKNKKFKLYMTGGGPEEEELIKRIKRRGLQNNIFILGFMKNKADVYKKMKESEFFFFPTYEDGWGIARGEALYCGCKVICYKLKLDFKKYFGDFPEFVRAGDIESFVRSMSKEKNLKAQKRFMKKYDYRTQVKRDIRFAEKYLGLNLR